MEEVIYFQDGSTVVSSTRVELNNQTFATRNIGSVKVTKTARTWRLGALLLAVGAASWPASPDHIFSVLLFAVATFVLWRGAPRFSLVLVTGGGEVSALSANKLDSLAPIRDAVAKAISIR